MKHTINLKLIVLMILASLTSVVKAQTTQSDIGQPNNSVSMQVQALPALPSNIPGHPYSTLDSVGSPGCYNNAHLTIVNTFDSAGHCVFVATASVSTSNYIVGYQWSGAGATVVHHNHTSGDTYTFTVSSGTTATISVIIYLVNVNFTDSTSPCCQVNLSQSVTCDSIPTTSCCIDTVHSNLTYTSSGLLRCNFNVTAHMSTLDTNCHVVGYIWQSPGYYSGLVGWSTYSPPLVPLGSSTYVTVTFVAANAFGDTCKFSKTLNLKCTLIKHIDTIIIIGHTGHFHFRGIDETGNYRDEDSDDDTYIGQMNVFPNPANNVVTVASEGELITNIQVIDIYGKKLADYSYENTTSAKVSLETYPPGTYLFRINKAISKVVTKR